MKRNIIATLLAFSFSFSILAPASAQTIAALGEVKANGRVFIESTGGQWLSAPATYPLLQNTGIRIDDGSASLYFKEGSRIDIAKNSLARIDGSSGQFTVHMTKGTLAFNMAPGSSLSVQTASASVSVNKRNPLVQKVSLEKSGRVLGVISATEKGTEIRSIAGRIVVDFTPTETKLISSGESIFVDANNAFKVYHTQAIAAEGQHDNLNDWSPVFFGSALLLGGAAYWFNTSGSSGSGIASPSFP